MPISETGRPMPTSKAIDPRLNAQRDAGFSLTELMIVVFIMGVVSSFILLSAPPSRLPLEDKAEDVRLLLRQASEESVISGTAYGALVGEREVQLVRRWEGTWLPVSGARVGVPRDVMLTLDSDSAEQSEGTPQIIFDPIGSASPATLLLDTPDAVLAVSVTPAAAITVEDQDAR